MNASVTSGGLVRTGGDVRAILAPTGRTGVFFIGLFLLAFFLLAFLLAFFIGLFLLAFFIGLFSNGRTGVFLLAFF